MNASEDEGLRNADLIERLIPHAVKLCGRGLRCVGFKEVLEVSVSCIGKIIASGVGDVFNL